MCNTSISDITDSLIYSEAQWFKSNPEALSLQLYSDAVEVTNPLGAAKGEHKLLMVYASVLHIPPRYRSKVDNSFLVLVARYNEVKDSPQLLFKPLVDDLKDLDAGITVGEDLVKAGLLEYCGVKLECDEIGGFQTHFNAGYPCRHCLIPYTQLQTHFPTEPYYPVWTVEKYDRITEDFPKIVNSQETEAQVLQVSDYIADLEASEALAELGNDAKDADKDEHEDEDDLEELVEPIQEKEDQLKYGL